MSKPVGYSKTVTVVGAKASDFRGLLDPRDWDDEAGAIWRKSYLVADESALRKDLSDDPDFDPALDQKDIWAQPSKSLMFEDVTFGAFRYRNVLTMSFEPRPGVLRFAYGEHQCLTTVIGPNEGDELPGGVDVDIGVAEAKDVPGDSVELTFSKTVRFTQPEESAPILNMLAAILVPLALDSWLQTLTLATKANPNV